MSSRRDLKKDIDYIIAEVISDCFTFLEFNQGEKEDEVTAILNDAVNLRNDLIARVNNPDGKDNPKILKAFYKSVVNDLYTESNKLFERLSSLIPGKK